METIDHASEPWPRCPEAAEYFISLFRAFAAHNPDIGAMADRFLEQAGVPLLNLIDHWTVPHTFSLTEELVAIGLKQAETEDGDTVWEHPDARLPRLRVDRDASAVRIAIAVEDLRHFAECNSFPVVGQHGDPDSGYEEVRYAMENDELAVIVRRGYRGFRPGRLTAGEERTLAKVRRELSTRARTGNDDAEETAVLVRTLSEDIHSDRLTDEFFAAEREYYMARNRAARYQYDRQQVCGFGWANHDHHTYRSSRAGFRSLIELWTLLGFQPREKFYAGADAGWGAQILEHPASRVVLFCDVDIAPDEVDVDYSAAELEPLGALGTIGLWCALHGESVGAAGLHHLEAEFEFSRAQGQMVEAGIGVMSPFTDLPMLKQAFTQAEIWQVAPERARNLVDAGLITSEQCERILTDGAPGSHLEILQRWEGFKGFNKTGISSIIRHTDARLMGGRS